MRRIIAVAKKASPAFVACVLLTWSIYVGHASGARGPTGALGGDFAAFYTAAQIVKRGQGDRLYDPELQRLTQHEIPHLTFREGEWLRFSYPAFVAVALWPLTLVPYAIAYMLYTVAMLGALGCVVWILARMNSQLASERLPLFALMLCTPPVAMSVFLGQNSILTLLLFLSGVHALGRRHEIWAGISFGLMLFKPQFAAPALALLVGARAWKACGGSIAVASALWTTGALADAEWVSRWPEHSLDFRDADATLNARRAVSLAGLLSRSGVHLPVLTYAGFVGGTIVGYLGGRRLHAETSHHESMAWILPFAVFASPHAMRYETACVFVLLATAPVPVTRVALAIALSGLSALDGVFGAAALGVCVWEGLRRFAGPRR